MTQLTLQLRNESYHQVNKETMQGRMVSALERLGKASNSEIAKHLNIGINQVTGRIKELRDQGFVRVAGKKRDLTTNRTVTVFELT